MKTRSVWSMAGCWLAVTAAGLVVWISLSLAGPEAAEASPGVVLPPLPDEARVPFGEPVDGIALRVIVPAEVCPGQAIPLTVQVKNLSQRERYLSESYHSPDSQFVRIEIKGPDGKPLRQSARSEGTVLPKSFKRLQPGEIWRADIPDLQSELFIGEFREAGNYTFSYTFNGPKLPAKSAVGERVSHQGGREVRERTFDVASPAQLAGAWSGSVTAKPAQMTISPMQAPDLTVHEWGVFTVFNEQKFANLNRKAEWGNLPEFFYRQFPQQRLRWSPGAWDKPLIYFYSDRPALKLEVSVTFTDGVPVVWWPAASAPIDSGGTKATPVPRFNSLAWSGWLGSPVPNQGNRHPDGPSWITPEETPLAAGQWLAEARLKGAALFTVVGSKMQRSAPWTTDRLESERFIYYDGLVPSPDYLHCLALTDSSATVKKSATFPIGRLYLLDRRQPEKPRAACAALAAAEETKLDLAPVADLPAFIQQIRADLIAAGLFDAEAESLLKIWHQGFFENSGVVAFYLLPQSEYDRMLPLAVSPKPAAAPTRVGIAFHPNFDAEPAITARVAALIRQLDAEDCNTREDAMRQLSMAGPAALRLLQQAAQAGSEEVRDRAGKIIAAADASEWLK
ncbi:MAG: hypothetical protein NTW21_26400 [Verrucomicrobia bacterium]|nr:hypothetical protein [Verrucomicrobiota bacterium]